MTITAIDYQQARRALELMLLLKKLNTRIVLSHLTVDFQTVTTLSNSILEYQQPEVSTVLAGLKKFGLVYFIRDGKCVRYKLDIDEIERINDVIKNFN